MTGYVNDTYTWDINNYSTVQDQNSQKQMVLGFFDTVGTVGIACTEAAILPKPKGAASF